MQKNRPLGVTIIAILAIFGGIRTISSGMATIAIVTLVGIVIGAILLISGIVYFDVAYGL
jgi:hypothetical protein